MKREREKKVMNNLITDVKEAINMFKRLRNARREGKHAEIKRTKEIKVCQVGYGFLDTVEGCALHRCNPIIYKTVKEIFEKFPNETKHALTSPPKEGEFIKRVFFWKDALKPEMDKKKYHIAIGEIIIGFVI